MNSRERVLTAFAHQEPDRVPMWCGASAEFWEKAKSQFGLDDEGLRIYFKDDFRRVFAKYAGPQMKISSGATYRTPFGIERHGMGYGQPLSHPLAEADIGKIHDYVFKTHINEVLLAREDAESLKAFHVIIEPGKYTHLHRHADTEQLYYVISGIGLAKVTNSNGTSRQFDLVSGDVFHIPRNIEHQIFCLSTDGPLRYLCVDGFPLGRPQDEPTWDDHYHKVLELQNTSPV